MDAGEDSTEFENTEFEDTGLESSEFGSDDGGEGLAELDPLETPPDHRSGFVAVIGRPNVGKSTLLNRLLGQKIAITSPKPQTTRDQLLGIYTTEQMQVMFLDTPGIHKPHNKLGEHMVGVAELSVEDADLVVWVVDATTDPTEEDLAIASMLHELYRRKKLHTPVIMVLNKADRVEQDSGGNASLVVGERLETYRMLAQSVQVQQGSAVGADAGGTQETDAPEGDGPVDVTQSAPWSIAISALHGTGVPGLLDRVRQALPLGPRYYPADQVTDLQTRFIVGELVREKALSLLQQEVPHSLAVVVDEFTPRDENMTYISAVIYVERASQKGIVLGRQGRTIKQIGQAARPEIEELVGTRVYLELWVKVWEKWRRREAMLRRLGYAVG